jgi:Domain of unknown function (DUF5668)
VRADRRPRFTPRLVVGLSILGLGMLFLLHEVTGASIGRILRFWPVALIVLGSTILWESGWYDRKRASGRKQSLGWGVFWILAGSWFLLDSLDWVRFDPWDYFWPILLLALGGSIVWRSLRGPKLALQLPSVADREQLFSAFAILSGNNVRNASQDFHGGEATAIMGGCEIDLREARIAEEAVVEVFALWGGVEIKVPQGWRVVSEALPLLGGYEDNTRRPETGASAPRLVIKGFAIMGGIEVSNG